MYAIRSYYASSVPLSLRQTIQHIFWHMHETETGQAILAQGQIQKMAQVEDWDYDLIRDMARVAKQVIWAQSI